MTGYKQMYDEWVAVMQAKGCGGIIELVNDYKNNSINQNHGTHSDTKTKSVNTTLSSEKKNERPAAGIGGPFLPIAKVVS
jgi:hypothetical protein